MSGTSNPPGIKNRLGVTIPFDDRPLGEMRSQLTLAADLGYSDVWTSEVGGADGFTPLALCAAWEPRLSVGTAVVPVSTRGPALLAMSAASIAQAAPGRFTLGIGASSPVIVSDWNSLAYQRPLARVRDIARFLRTALSGEKVTQEYETFSVKGFRLAISPPEPIPILLGALRPQMLELAGAEADGVFLNWLAPSDVPVCIEHVALGAQGSPREIAAKIFVCPNPDAKYVRDQARFQVAAYITVPAYAAFHRWLGRGHLLEETWSAWNAGDRKRAAAAIPDEVIDDLIVHGTPQACRARVAEYRANGVSAPALAILPYGVEIEQALRDLAP